VKSKAGHIDAITRFRDFGTRISPKERLSFVVYQKYLCSTAKNTNKSIEIEIIIITIIHIKRDLCDKECEE
jgi:hypothetical protein